MSSEANLVSVEELKKLMENKEDFDKKYRLIETNVGEVTRDSYNGGHIENAVFLDMMRCTEPTPLLPKNIQKRECFQEYVGSLGISNDHHLIIYDRSQFGFFASSRMWWIFKLFGQDKVSVLNGGLNAWTKAGNELKTDVPSYEKQVFVCKEENKEIMRTYEQVVKMTENPGILGTLVDARPEADFNKKDESDPTKINHIPNAKNVPLGTLVDTNSGLLKKPEELKELFNKAGVNLNGPIVTSCMTGMGGSSLALAFNVIGQKQVALYYGSWTEYSQRSAADKKQ